MCRPASTGAAVGRSPGTSPSPGRARPDDRPPGVAPRPGPRRPRVGWAPGAQGAAARCRRPGRGERVVGVAPARHRRRRGADRVGAVDAGARGRPRPAARRVRRADGRCSSSGIGVLVYAYAYRYFSPGADGLGRLVALLTLFAGSMFGLVVADNLLVLYGFWELTSITSFLLIGNDHRDGRGPGRRAAGAARHQRRRARDARRVRRARPGGRHVPAERDPRRPAVGHHGRRSRSC